MTYALYSDIPAGAGETDEVGAVALPTKQFVALAQQCGWLPAGYR